MPKVSVIIPCYNAARFLPFAVQSALIQTYRDMEIIVVDDGSTDNTREVLEPFINRIQYFYQENKKPSAARNTGIKNATGEYVAFLDADDIWLPNKIEKQIVLLDKHPDVALVGCRALFIDANNKPASLLGSWVDGKYARSIEISDMVKRMFLGDPIPGGGSTAMARLRLLQTIGGFDEMLDYAEDWDTWFRLAYLGLVAYIPRILVCYRVFGSEKILRREASEELLSRPFNMIEKAMYFWTGDLKERDQLAAQGIGKLYQRAALANFQLGNAADGKKFLEEAVRFNPEIGTRDRIIHLAVDRSKMIESNSCDFASAEAFLNLYFNNLPSTLPDTDGVRNEAFAWLYIGCAFERSRKGERWCAIKSLVKAIWIFPKSLLTNRGVRSLAFELIFGKKLADFVRSLKSKSPV